MSGIHFFAAPCIWPSTIYNIVDGQTTCSSNASLRSTWIARKKRYLIGSFVLQAEFSEINLAAYSDSGTVVDIQVSRGGTKVVR